MLTAYASKAENGNTFSTALLALQQCIHFWKIGVSSTQSVDLNLPGFWSAVKHVLRPRSSGCALLEQP